MNEENLKVIPPDCREFDLKIVEEDPRFLQCKKELIWCVVLWLILMAVILFGMFVLGGRGFENFTFIGGIPDYLLFIFIGIAACTIFTFIVIKKKFKNMSLEPSGGIEDEE